MAKRYEANWKTRDDVFDAITPNNKFASDYIIAPAGEFKPAAWLPIQWKDTASKDAFVISSGKVVAMDSEGRIVPAGLAKKMLVDSLDYTADDVANGVIDLTTGAKVTAAVSYTALAVAKALVERGLVLEDDVAAVTAAEVIPEFISAPVGICSYDVYVWAGDDPASFHNHNYQKQHLVAFQKQVQLVVPHMSSSDEAADDFDVAALDGGGSTAYAVGSFVDAGEYWDAANVSQLARYSGSLTAASPVVALGLAHQPIATPTDRTPFTCDVAGVLVRARSSADALKVEGDYFVDAKAGVLFLHSDTWATQLAAAATLTFSYSFYDDAGAAAQRFVHLDGRVKPGSKVTFDAESNLVLADLSSVPFYEVVGTVYSLISEPRGLLDKVKTAWNFSGADKSIQMPGSATKGFSDLITLTDETVADELAVVFIDIQ